MIELTANAAVVRSFLAMAPDPAADPHEQLARSQDELDNIPSEDAGQFSTLLMIGYCQLALHDVQAATAVLEKARHIALLAGLYFGVVESTFHLARLLQSSGLLARAEELCRQTQADLTALLAHPEQELPAVGSLEIVLGCIHLEQNQLAEAEQELLHGNDLVGWGMNPYYQMAACVALFRLREFQGRPEEALAVLSHLESAWPDIAFCTGALRIQHNLRTSPHDPGVQAEAAAWCRTFSPSFGGHPVVPGLGPFGAAEVYYLAYLSWVWIQIASGNSEAALPYIDQLLALAEANGLKTRLIEGSLLEAQAAYASGDRSRTWLALERALAAGQPEGYLRIFDQGPFLAELLSQAAGRGIYPGYIARIDAASQSTPNRNQQESGGIQPGRGALLAYGEHLSDRELQVLRLMARGTTNQAIAEQLVITVGTVKSHINHILAKLDVHNRTEAVARARELGLLDI